jgi:threonine dehydratase
MKSRAHHLAYATAAYDRLPVMTERSAIAAAATRVAPHVRHTPVITMDGELPALNFPVRLKLELLQSTGSFKPRGTFNRMLNATIPEAGVIAASGGNHGAAVAYVAPALGVKAEIFVPTSTPATTINRIASYGAVVMREGGTSPMH